MARSLLDLVDDADHELARGGRECVCGGARAPIANARAALVEAKNRVERERIRPTGDFDLSDVEAALSGVVKP